MTTLSDLTQRYLRTIRDPERRAHVTAIAQASAEWSAARETDIAVVQSLAQQVADNAWRLHSINVPQQTVDRMKTRLYDMLWQLGIDERR